MNTPELILQLYNKAIAGQSTQSIKQAEQHLLKLEHSSTFISDNAAILSQPKIPLHVKKFAALYLNKYSKRLVKAKSVQKCEITIHQFLAILSNPGLQLEVKSLFVSSLEVLLNSQHYRAVKLECNKKYVSLVNETVNKQDSQIDFTLIVFYGQAIFLKDSFSQDAREIVKATILSLIKLAARLINRAAEQTMQNRQLLLTILRVLKQYSILLKLYFKRLALLDIQSMKILYLQELEGLITSALKLNVKQNGLESTVFVSIPQDQLISKIINLTKANFIIILTNAVRLIFTFTKHPNLFATNPLYLKVPEILTYLIKNTSLLLQSAPYYKLPNKIMMLETIDEVLQFMVSCLRVNHFYPIFYENRLELIDQIILPCLSTTPKDIENFYEDTMQFVQNTLQIVRRFLNTSPMGVSISNQQPEDEIKQYQTLRTLTAELLSAYCKFQDGTLSHIIDFALGVLSNKVPGDKSLMYLVICILAPQFDNRQDLKLKIVQTIMQLVEKCAIPVVNGTRKVEDIQYAYLLLTLSKIFLDSLQIFPSIVSQSYKIGVSIIQSPSTNEAHKYFVYQLFNSMAKTQQASKYAHDLLMIYNHLLKNMQEPSFYFLESYFELIKQNYEEYGKNPEQVIEGIKIVCFHIEVEAKKPQPTQILFSKYWNIIRQIGENSDFIPALIQPIEEAILPLLQYIDGVSSNNFEEDVLMLLTSFIEKGKMVTQNQQKMFQIIPRIFYSQYSCRFGHSFYAIQLFIYYGSNVLSSNIGAIKAIIEMSLTSISTLQYKKKLMAENENCQGALILQSLILKCGAVFTVDIWSSIINIVSKRLNETTIRFNLLSSNLYALLSLALIHSHKFFPNDENEVLMTRIISDMRVFNKMQYSPKVIIAGLTELLMLSDSDFIGRRFTQILDTVITMLEITSSKKENYFDDEEDEEKEYANSIIMLKNDLKNLDEFIFFRQQVEKLKAKNLPLLQKCVMELPKTKKEFFTHILRVERVANEPRQIYKIKR